MKHLQIRHLFLKQLVRAGVVTLEKVAGKANPADAMTKPLGGGDLRHCMQMLPCCYAEWLQQTPRRDLEVAGSHEVMMMELSGEEQALYSVGALQ